MNELTDQVLEALYKYPELLKQVPAGSLLHRVRREARLSLKDQDSLPSFECVQKVALDDFHSRSVIQQMKAWQYVARFTGL